jgi:hypothetical protein
MARIGVCTQNGQTSLANCESRPGLNHKWMLCFSKCDLKHTDKLDRETYSAGGKS